MKKSFSRIVFFGVMFVFVVGIIATGSAKWQISVVDGATGDAGQYACLKLDSYDLPHIAYRVENPDSLKYAYLQVDHWIYETPLNSEGMGEHISMALNPLDSAMIAHFDPAEARLMFTERVGGSNLDTVVLDDQGYTGIYTSLALDTVNNPHICYYRGDNHSLITKSRSGGWVSYFPHSNVDPSATGIVTDSSNVMHIVYNDHYTDTLVYAYNIGSTWSSQVVDTSVVVTDCQILMDSNENLHIMYMDSQTGDLKYAFKTGAVWSIEVACPLASPFTNCLSFVLDSNDVPHCVFYSSAQTLVYFNRLGGTWQGDAIDDNGDVGFHCSLDIDSNDYLHVAYYDRDSKNLKYARQMPPNTPTPTVTPTATPSEMYTELVMDDTFMTAGETFLLERTYKNALGSSVAVDEYMLLDILGMYWFWPGWTEALDFSQWTVSTGGPTTDTVLTFMWPTVDGEFTGIRFWSAFLHANTDDLISYDMIEWGYGDTPPAFTLTSTAFDNGQSIPDMFTCEGVDVSPELTWNQPEQTIQSYAIIMDDPDAPGGDWIHWVIFDIPATSRGLSEDIPNDPTLPDGSVQGNNSWNTVGYRGPCPPSGGAHRYFFKLYALDTMVGLASGATKAELLTAMEGHILYQTELMGTYQR